MEIKISIPDGALKDMPFNELQEMVGVLAWNTLLEYMDLSKKRVRATIDTHSRSEQNETQLSLIIPNEILDDAKCDFQSCCVSALLRAGFLDRCVKDEINESIKRELKGE